MKKVYVIAVVLALIAGLAVFYFASSLRQEQTSTEVQKKAAVVAVVNLPANTVINADMVSLQMLPAEAVNPLTYGTLEEVIGSVTKYPISAAEQVMSSKIVKAGESTSKLAYSLEDGQRAISMPVSSISGIAGNVYAGDYVDVMAMMMVPNAAGDGFEAAATFVLQKMQVLSTGMNSQTGQVSTPNYGIVTIAGTPDQILQLYYAMNTAYTATDNRLMLVLRPATDDDVLDTTYYRPKY